MGRSASKLSSTRSAVVSSTPSFPFFFFTAFLIAGLPHAGLAFLCCASFPFFAPPPPLALLRRQPWILCLSDGGLERIQHANVLMLPGDSSQPGVHRLRVLLCQLRDAANAQQFEIAKHGGPDRNQILQ